MSLTWCGVVWQLRMRPRYRRCKDRRAESIDEEDEEDEEDGEDADDETRADDEKRADDELR